MLNISKGKIGKTKRKATAQTEMGAAVDVYHVPTRRRVSGKSSSETPDCRVCKPAGYRLPAPARSVALKRPASRPYQLAAPCESVRDPIAVWNALDSDWHSTGNTLLPRSPSADGQMFHGMRHDE